MRLVLQPAGMRIGATRSPWTRKLLSEGAWYYTSLKAPLALVSGLKFTLDFHRTLWGFGKPQRSGGVAPSKRRTMAWMALTWSSRLGSNLNGIGFSRRPFELGSKVLLAIRLQ